jgi:nucleotide-binding universal stress UspA family protein
VKILVPVDGSPASIRAVRLAVDQVKALPDASLVLVNVQNFSGLSLPEQQEERAAGEPLKTLSESATSEQSVTSPVQSEAALQQRSIAWLATNTSSISSWGRGGLEESAAYSLAP